MSALNTKPRNAMLHRPADMTASQDIPDVLHELRQQHPEIDTAVFLDYRAGSILCMSAVIARHQEKLDKILQISARILGGEMGARDRFVLASPVEVLAVQATETGMALALILEPDVAPERAVEIAGAAVRQLGNAGGNGNDG